MSYKDVFDDEIFAEIIFNNYFMGITNNEDQDVSDKEFLDRIPDKYFKLLVKHRWIEHKELLDRRKRKIKKIMEGGTM